MGSSQPEPHAKYRPDVSYSMSYTLPHSAGGTKSTSSSFVGDIMGSSQPEPHAKYRPDVSYSMSYTLPHSAGGTKSTRQAAGCRLSFISCYAVPRPQH